MDKETVQTTNSKEATKAVVVRITDWSLVQVQVPPPFIIYFLESINSCQAARSVPPEENIPIVLNGTTVSGS